MFSYVVRLAVRPDCHVLLIGHVRVYMCVSVSCVENHNDKGTDLVWIAGQSESHL